jgi:hypothetical protein
MQAAQLQYDEEQTDYAGKAGFQEVLPVLQYAHGA